MEKNSQGEATACNCWLTRLVCNSKISSHSLLKSCICASHSFRYPSAYCYSFVEYFFRVHRSLRKHCKLGKLHLLIKTMMMIKRSTTGTQSYSKVFSWINKKKNVYLITFHNFKSNVWKGQYRTKYPHIIVSIDQFYLNVFFHYFADSI